MECAIYFALVSDSGYNKSRVLNDTCSQGLREQRSMLQLRRFLFWCSAWMIVSVHFDPMDSSSAHEPDATPQMARRIDHLLEAAFEQKRVSPAPQADDLEFLRRASLDLTGVVPRVSQVRAVMDSKQPLTGNN
ncbi:MAG: DUF1549 domain-containing protein [Pirellulaceae bacterium]